MQLQENFKAAGVPNQVGSYNPSTEGCDVNKARANQDTLSIKASAELPFL